MLKGSHLLKILFSLELFLLKHNTLNLKIKIVEIKDK
ncbi:hypothetical protein AAUPMC_04349, partial [Pasteurella multocida subsp. multocida str. Anand1_cattle]